MKWFYDLKMGYKLLTLFIIFLLFFSLVVFVGVKSSNSTNKLIGTYYNNVSKTTHLYNAIIDFKDIRVLLRDHIAKTSMTEKDETKNEIDRKFANINEEIKKYKSFNMSDEEQLVIKQFDEAYLRYQEVLDTVLKLSYSKKSQEAYAYIYGDGSIATKNILAIIDKIIAAASKDSQKAYEDSKNMYVQESRTQIGIGVFGLIAVLLICFVIANTITKTIKKFSDAMTKVEYGDLTVSLKIDSKDEIGSLAQSFNDVLKSQREILLKVSKSTETINNSLQNISCTTEELTTVTQDQANITEEFTTSIEQMDLSLQDVTNNMLNLVTNISDVSNTMNGMSNAIQDTSKNVIAAAISTNRISKSIEQMDESIKSISEHAKDVKGDAENTVIKAKEGNVSVNHTIEEMDKIFQAATGLSTAIEVLGGSAEQIGEIVNVIEDIAEQTNLLSLNAAIEAARAGDAGKGFAVVANSIRGLAEKSGEATKDISKIIKGIQSEVSNAVSIANDSTERVKEGVQFVKNTGHVFEDIFKAVNNTNFLVQEITDAIGHQELRSREITSSAEQMNDLVNQISATLEQQAAETDEIVKVIDKINQLMQQVSSATEEQSVSSQEVVSLIQGLNQGIQEVFNSSEEISNSATGLANQSRELLAVVNLFRVK